MGDGDLSEIELDLCGWKRDNQGRRRVVFKMKCSKVIGSLVKEFFPSKFPLGLDSVRMAMDMLPMQWIFPPLQFFHDLKFNICCGGKIISRTTKSTQ